MSPAVHSPFSAHAPTAVSGPAPTAAVAARLMDEGLISLSQVAAMLPPVRGGRKVSTSSVFRWIHRGKNGVRLEAIRLHGGGWWTSKPALARFAAGVTVADG